MTTTWRRRLAPALIGTGIALGVTAAAGAEELRIGFVAPTTGIFAQIGKDMVDGFQLYLDQHGNKLGGMDVKFIVEDDQGKPDTGVTKAKKMILQDKVHMIVGGLLASTGYALAPVSTAEKTLYISSTASADDLTQRQLDKYPYFLRTSWTSSLPHHALGQWACDNGFKTVSVVAADYAFGYEVAGGFQKAFEDCGGKVVQKVWVPLNTKDFGPYIPTIKNADAIFTVMVGPGALQFPKQLRGAGIKTPIVGSGVSYDEFVLPFMGDEVIGDISALHYSAAIDTPVNQAFVKAYRAKFGKVPGYYSENNYSTAMWLDEAIKKAGGKYPGPEEFIKVMQSIKIDAPRGPVELDDMRNPVENVYIKKVEKKKMFGYDKDELWNTVVHTYPKVSQFWTYGKDKFLAQPLYSRDFPPCKYCE
ncbi:ABC transporter substrate-binding protein [Microbacteriaceae bacterium K1510]|nr:ABC transporter substrate-binding protein [Microbacteriaceae bacterium K1510]